LAIIREEAAMLPDIPERGDSAVRRVQRGTALGEVLPVSFTDVQLTWAFWFSSEFECPRT
jgi:hypothetical protein